ncbi:iron-containing redox enzyme family protein [Streptomyces sp. 1222.5]|uniref:iron-containing redox enzyme family protein n=1 Tax=Streptomyces sp. 1222.5 TaxID=1881026 RepID=UPI003EB6B824
MTASVDSWIAGAGDRCLQLGHQALGKALKAHARAEAGHDQMMIADAHAIAAKLYQDFAIPIDVGNLLASPPLASAQAYAALHERVISGHTPQAQLAIEYEIEQLSITIGPPVVKKCREVFGSDTRFYSFLAEHVELDAGHTAFNRKQLQYLLSESPEALASMTDAGRAALSLYTDFVAECLRLAHADLRTGDPA